MSDQLVEQLQDFIEDQEGSVADRTFRALVEQRLTTVETALSRVMARQDQILFGIVLLFAGGLVSLFIRGG